MDKKEQYKAKRYGRKNITTPNKKYQSLKNGDYHTFCKTLASIEGINFKCYGDYEYKLNEIKENHFNFTNPKWEIKEEEKILFIRHDIDRCLITALKMAQIENKYNIKSTFFILLTGPYMSHWLQNKKKLIIILKEIESLGHEVGLHYDMYGEYFKNNRDVHTTLSTQLTLLRENGITIKGCAAHGGTIKGMLKSKYTPAHTNWTIWEELFPTRRDLKVNNKKISLPALSLSKENLYYEAYFIERFTKTTAYISDGSGIFWKFNAPQDNIESHIIPPSSLKDNIKKLQKTNIISLLTHPHMWLNGGERSSIMPNNLIKNIKNFKL